MSNLVVIVMCLALGLLLQRLRRFPDNSATTLNLYVIYLALPALVLSEIPKLVLDREALLPVIATWLIMSFSALITWLTCRTLGWSRQVTGVLMLLVPLGNTSFVGFPLIDAFLGSEALPYAILYDHFGTFIALNTYGVLAAAWYSGTSTNRSGLVWNILSFPPVIALCLAFVTYPLDYPEWLSTAIARIAVTLVPVVMVAVGLQWTLRLDRAHLGPFCVGLGYKLLLIPAVVLLALWSLGLEGLPARVVVLEAAMPAMISAGALAMAHNLAPRLASALVGYGLLISLLSVALWKQVIPF
jgi:hypothetical protein